MSIRLNLTEGMRGRMCSVEYGVWSVGCAVWGVEDGMGGASIG